MSVAKSALRGVAENLPLSTDDFSPITRNGLMAIPNLIAVFLLAPVVAKLTKEYFTDVRQRELRK